MMPGTYRTHFRPWMVNGGALVLMLLGACVSVPLQEISDARQAVRAAQEIGAERRAPIHYERAEILLGRAERAMATGEYEKAWGEATLAREEALKARERSLEAVRREKP
ncbi:MAG: DUF4398 domain-containing protein [Gammaproteobacteria bacterium]